MRLFIKHLTEYAYDKAVTLQPHHLYFYPAHRNYLQLLDFKLGVAPNPSGLAFRVDAENNAFHQCWFHGEHSLLKIQTEIVVETHEINPFDFIVTPLPSLWPSIMQPYLELEPMDVEINKWVKEVTDPAGSNLVTLLTFLNRELYADWNHTVRYEPTLLAISDCFNTKTGSCRDLSWLMIQMIRSLNIPARFVSGYSFNPELGEGHELHAWVEAFLPGAGWIGLDPNSGLLATDHYIPVVASYLPANTFPVQGHFSGKATSQLSFEVIIEQS